MLLRELVAIRAQRPRWFVAHWWGELIKECLTSLTAHAKTGSLSLRSMPAAGFRRMPQSVGQQRHRSHDTTSGTVSSADPSKAAFHRALALSEGTVVLVDQKAGTERLVQLRKFRRSRPAAAQELLSLRCTRRVRRTRGPWSRTQRWLNSGRYCEHNGHHREEPQQSSRAMINLRIELASATVDADRAAIFNKLTNMADLSAPPLENSPKFEIVNSIRGRFAAAGLVRAFTAGAEANILQQAC